MSNIRNKQNNPSGIAEVIGHANKSIVSGNIVTAKTSLFSDFISLSIPHILHLDRAIARIKFYFV